MKNNHSITKVTLMAFAISGIIAGTTALSVLAKNSGGVQLSPSRRSLATETAESVDPSEYSEISSVQLAPKIVSYTGTSLSRHLNVQFESQVINAFAPSDKDVFYVIEDERYTGERSDPFNVDVPDKTLNGFVYQAHAKKGATSLYISNSISYGSRFIVKNCRVAANAMYRTFEYNASTQQEDVTYTAYEDIQTIYICDGIEEIASHAFKDVPESVTFKCVAPSKPEGWADDWTDANASQIEWGATLDDTSKESVRHSGSTTSFGDAEDFILGYKGNQDIKFGAYPLTVSYEKTKADGTKVTEYQTIPTKHQTNPYDAVGSKIYGKTSSFEITINLEKGEVIDEHSYEFYNIFRAKRYYIEEKETWPIKEIQNVFDNYSLPMKVENTEDYFIPSIEGDSFFHQAFETGEDKYLTIAHEFATEEAAEAMLSQFKNKITSFEIDKAVYQSEENLKYTLLENYLTDKYGEVYKLALDINGVKTNIFVQFYTFFNEGIEKYEFVTYIVLDRPVAKTNEEVDPPVVEYVDSRELPLAQKASAIRPFIYVPEYEETKDDQGNVTARTPKEKLKVNSIVRFNRTINIEELITTKYQSSSRFLSYSSIGMTVNKVLGTAYAGYIKNGEGNFDESSMKAFVLGSDGKYYNGSNGYAKEDVKITGEFKAPLLYINDTASRNKVETNLSAVLSGDIKFRYTFSSLNMASIIVSYRKGGEILEKELPIKSPSPVIEVNQETANKISFLIDNNKLEGIDTKDILAVGVSGMTINIHLYNSASHNVVQNTQYINVFGNIEVLPYSEKALSFFDINAYLIIFYLALAVVYAIIAVVLFFYRKNKYKNDEFRRMRPKAYLKSALFGFFGLILVTAMVNFVVMRFAVFYSTVPTFNPIDAFVIAFGIFGAIAVGFFIRNAVTAIKLMRKRQEIKKLHLDTDAADDGTK